MMVIDNVIHLFTWHIILQNQKPFAWYQQKFRNGFIIRLILLMGVTCEPSLYYSIVFIFAHKFCFLTREYSEVH